MSAPVECQCGRDAEFVRRSEGAAQYPCDIYKCECGLWHSVSVDAGDVGASPCFGQVLGQCSYAIFSRRREPERLAALDVGRCTAGPCTMTRTWLAVARWHLRCQWLARLVEVSQ